MKKHQIDIDIFKKVTGNYYLNYDEGKPDDVIEIIGHSCFLNHKAIGGIGSKKIEEVLELQNIRDKKEKEKLNYKLKIAYVLGKKDYENSEITVDNLSIFINEIYNDWLEFDKYNRDIGKLESLYKFLDRKF